MSFSSSVWKTASAASGLALVACSVSLKHRKEHRETRFDPTLEDVSCGSTFQPSLAVIDVDSRPEDQARQNASAEKLKNAVAKSKEIIWTKMYETGLPGLSVAVSVDGKTVWKHGFGYQDVENRVTTTGSTVMRIASISKPITATVVAKLWEEGRLNVDDPVEAHLGPGIWPSDKRHITLRQLLSHSSGIRHYEKKSESGKPSDPREQEARSAGEFCLNKKFETTAEALELFKNDELLCKPGEAFNYTTHGYTVLAMVVEKITGEPFSKCLKKTFAELGLSNTYLDEHEPIVYNRAKYYRRDSNHRLVNAPHVDNSYKWAGGGLQSNVQDLVKFGNAMLYSHQWDDGAQKAKGNTKPMAETVSYNLSPFASVNRPAGLNANLPGYLKRETVRQMWTSVISCDEGEKDPTKKRHDGLGYGLGWFVSPAVRRYAFCRDQKFLASHTGGAVGASSVLLILPRDDGDSNGDDEAKKHPPEGVVVAIVCNMEGIGFTNLALDVAKCFETLRPARDAYRVQKVFQC